MFKMGGSTSGGITSGLKRARYLEGERVTAEDILKSYGPAPRSSNVYDFLIDFGLNIASIPPQGNIISTAAAAAREPFSRFTEGKSKGEQLAYAMRAQAADKAMDVNLSREKMDLQKYLGEIQAKKQQDGFLKLDNRPGFIMDQAKLFSESKQPLERTHPQGMAEWEAIKLYDKIDVQLAPTVESKGVYAVDETQFKPGDETNIYWDPIEREYFTIKFNDAGVVQIDQTMEASYGDPENNYMDTNLQKLNSIIQNKKEADEIQSMDEGTSDENILTSMVTENKLEEGMVHPTVDGTATGEISDEYILAYAKENKIPLLNKPDGSSDNYKGMGGKEYWSRFPINFRALKNKMKSDNQPNIFKDSEIKREKIKKERAFKYFSRKRGDKTNYDLIKEGSLNIFPAHAPYLKEYEESLQTVVAEAN
jgi:hypothetical protein